MTKEEKQLLLKDLCARLSYGVICHTEEGDGHLCSISQTIFGTEYGVNISPIKRDYFNDSEQDEVVIKPYLRAMSSITKEEEDELGELITIYDMVDYMLAHHFDVHNLIEKGLALEAPEGMYKTE